ncbi:DUF5956 family protein [Flindersiella endophytica]
MTSVRHDWGLGEPPHPVAGGHAGRSELEPADLPEVRQLVGEGWELAPDAPMYVFLPAVWPAELRTWVPDRSTRYATNWRSSPSDPVSRVPWEEELRRDLEAGANRDLERVGIAPRPPDRLWLLRPPAGFARLDALLTYLAVEQAEQRGLDPSCNPAFVGFVGDELRRLGPGVF